MSSRARDWSTLYLVIACVLVFAPLAQAQRAGVINDPDGFVNVRAEKSADAAVIATVKAGEPFTFECENDADWCKATLTSGQSGSDFWHLNETNFDWNWSLRSAQIDTKRIFSSLLSLPK